MWLSNWCATSLAPRDLGQRIIYGKTPLTPDLEKAMHPDFLHGIRVAVDQSRVDEKGVGGRPAIGTLFVETCRFTHPDAPGDYVFWVLTDTAGYKSLVKDDAALLQMSGADAAALAEKFTRHYHPSIRVIVEKQDPKTSATWASQCSSPEGIPAWPTQRRVTILGDAVHAVPPTGGLGGNLALNDVRTLLETLLEGKGEMEEGGLGEERLRGWEERMRAEAEVQVKLVFAAATNTYPLSMWRPLVEQLYV